MLLAAWLFAQVMPLLLPPAPAPSPGPSASPVAYTGRQRNDVVDVEAGGSQSYLNAGKARWDSGYADTTFAAPSGFKLHLDAVNTVQFRQSQDTYAIRTDVPIDAPHGLVDFGYAYSPRSTVQPTNAFFGGYDLRTNGGWGYQFGYVGRDFAQTSAANYTLGTDKRWKHQHLGYFVSLSTQSRKTGLGILQGLRWGTDLPADSITLVSAAGRGVESTAPRAVAVHDVFEFDAGELHWLDPHTAIRLDAGYFSVSHAYQRFMVLMGLRVRIGNLR